jgi:hypothetical protein
LLVGALAIDRQKSGGDPPFAPIADTWSVTHRVK